MQHQLSNATGAAPSATPTLPQASKPEKKERISKALRRAIDLLVTGQCQYQKDAAKRAGMNETTLCKALRRPSVRVFLEQRARETIATIGTARAAARIVSLVDASSEHVSLDASKHVLGIAGIKPAAEAQVSVNVDIKAGYIIDLTPQTVTADQREIAAKPLIEHEMGRAGAARPADRNR